MDEMVMLSLEVGILRKTLSDVVKALTDVEARLTTLEAKIAPVLLESEK
jgi:hypothetical protein